MIITDRWHYFKARAELLGLTCVINAETLWKTWQMKSVSKGWTPQENFNKNIEKNKKLQEKTEECKIKTPTMSYGINGCG